MPLNRFQPKTAHLIVAKDEAKNQEDRGEKAAKSMAVHEVHVFSAILIRYPAIGLATGVSRKIPLTVYKTRNIFFFFSKEQKKAKWFFIFLFAGTVLTIG